MSIAEKLTQIAENEQRVFDAGYEKGKSDGGYQQGLEDGIEQGKQAEYDRFWDDCQQNGERINYKHGFCGGSWTDETFKPKYPIVPTGSNAYYIFQNSRFIKPDLSMVDFSKCGGIVQTFFGSTVQELGVLNFSSNGQGFGGLNQTFNSCTSLRKIEKIILPNANVTLSAFVECVALEEIRFEGVVYNSLNLQWCPLSVESMKNIISCLADYSGTNTYAYKVTFPEDRWAALEADSKAPDGGTWRDYVDGLGWNT